MIVEKNIEISELIDVYGNLLTQNQFNVMQSYYFLNYSLAEIAENLNITRQAVADVIKRSIIVLKSNEEKLKFLSKKRRVLHEINTTKDVKKIKQIMEE